MATKREMNTTNTLPSDVLASIGPTVSELATALRWHPESVRRAVRQNRIRAIRLGAAYRVPPDEVRRILTEGLPAVSRPMMAGKGGAA